MIVGILTLELHLYEADSLKAKRIIIKSLKDRIKNKFNVSVAEVGGNDLWQRSVLGAACIANETKVINEIFHRIKNIVINTPSIELLNSTIEMV